MLNLIIGVVLVALGCWGMQANWLMFMDTFKMLIFLALIGFGIVAVLAGVRQLGKKK